MVTAVFAGFIPIVALAELVNAGVLAAFILVCAAIIILRYRSPELERGYRAPLVPLMPAIGIIGSFILIVSLGPDTWIRFVVWLGLGFVVYFLYSRHHSFLARGELGIERDMPSQKRGSLLEGTDVSDEVSTYGDTGQSHSQPGALNPRPEGEKRIDLEIQTICPAFDAWVLYR